MRKFSPNHKKMLKQFTLFLAIFFVHLAARSQLYSIDSLMRNGERPNRINFVYLSDGFTSSELGEYSVKAAAVNNFIFSQRPFVEYKNFFNSYAIKIPSDESGAKHPGNATDEGSSGGQPIANPNNVFGSTFDYNGIHRLLVVQNHGTIFNTLGINFPDYTTPFVLVNSPYYGGSGGSYAVSSINSSSVEIAIHELGHTFGQLADEYWAGDIYAFEKPNMTKNSDPATIRWNKWIGINGIGVFQHGTVGQQALWYKPYNNCRMQNLGVPFCSVCTERLIDVIHEKIKMVDAYLPLASSITLINKNPVDFSLTSVQTNPSTITVNWYLNESPTPLVTNKSNVTIPFASFRSGANTVRAEVIDNTALAKTYMPAVGYVNTQSWTVNVSSEALPVHLKSFSGKVKDDAGLIEWEIDSPDDLQVFELEKSSDGLGFTKLASIQGQARKTIYQFTDPVLFRPHTYYRLKTIEKTGISHYSNIIHLQQAFGKFFYKVYQDADNHRYHLSVAVSDLQKVSYTIADMQGKIIAKKDFGRIEKQLEYDFDLNGKTPGIYFMTIYVNSSRYTAQLLAK